MEKEEHGMAQHARKSAQQDNIGIHYQINVNVHQPSIGMGKDVSFVQQARSSTEKRKVVIVFHHLSGMDLHVLD